MFTLPQVFRIVTGVLLVSLCCTIGCQPQQPFYLTEKGQYQRHLITKATRIEYPDADVPSSAEVCGTLAPLTLENPNPTDYWNLTLEESIQIALKNSKVIRSLNGVSFSKGGVAGTAGTLLSSPSAVSTVYDPALIESDPRYGVEAALSAFDGQLSMGANWSKSDDPTRSTPTQDDTGTFNTRIDKYTAAGGQLYVDQVNQYHWNPAATFGGYRNGWASYLEGGFTQPLLQGNGIQFNRIAGPGATPGFYNGVAIARINTDTALNDFEMAARNLVADVEKAYWNLYYAYHRLESVKSGRDAAHQTWSQTWAMFQVGTPGGRAQYEAQARQNYFAFRAQTELAQNSLFKVENALRYIMGETSTDGRLVRPTDEPIIAPLKLDWHNVMCEALYRSPELRKQKWNVKTKELELIASKNFLLPKLNLNAGYRWTGAGDDLINSRHHSNAFASMTSGNYASWVMGLNASMPLGWRKELAGVRNAQLNLAKSRALLQEQELELTHQLADSFREIQLAYKQSQTNLQLRIAADAEVRAVEAAYNAGTTTLNQLLDAQKRQAEAETDYYSTIVDYNLAIMTLHYRKGSLLEYNNVCLVEGAWTSKAYFDAKRRARQRDAGHQMNYGFTRPRVVSQGVYQQYQHNNYMMAPMVEPEMNPGQQREPKMAPPASVIETQSRSSLTPTLLPTVAPATTTSSTKLTTSDSQSINSPVSFTIPSVTAVSTPAKNRYLGVESQLPNF